MNAIASASDRWIGSAWEAPARELGLLDGGPANIGWLCSDRICALGRGGKPALLWENHEGRSCVLTFDALRRKSNAMAAWLQDLGIRPGERVCLFMDRVPELYLAFLAVLKMGGIVQPLFSAFGDESLHARLSNAGTAVVLTQRKHAPKLRKVLPRLPELRQVVIIDAAGAALREGELAFDLEALEDLEAFACHPAGPETPSVLHYTSGSTGQPKGAQHVHSSVLSQYWTAKQVLDLREDDVYWCNADPGWVTGTSYGIIGPWSNGITQAVLDAGFGSEAWYRFIERHRVTVWYSAPTAIRLLMRDGADLARRHDLSSLRHLASVGEPLNAEAVHWSREAFGLPFHDTYWQTETGSIVITNRPGLPIRAGSMGRPFPGITACVLDPQTREPITEPGRVGLIALRPDWPALIRTYWGNPAGFESKFSGGWYLTGDRASVDADGYYWFVGRDDDVINTGGHLVGPFEIESALIEHPAVAESAAVATPDPVNMEVVKAFIVLKPGHTADGDLELDIINLIRKRLSPLAMPQKIAFVDRLPKNRSGKIMRRVLRAQEFGEPVGDLSTLENE